jgi:hypothetical protein
MAVSKGIIMIDEVIKAMGGQEAIDRLESVAAVADCTGPNGAFTTEVLSLRPNKVLFRQASAQGAAELIVIGDQGWSRHAESGALDPLSAGMIYFARGHEFHLWLLELDKRYHDHQLAGEEMMDDILCHKLTMRAADESLVTLWLDANTYLPHQWQYPLPAAFGGDVLRYVLTEWQPVGDLTLFHAFTLYQGSTLFTYHYGSIALNNVDPGLFSISKTSP